MNVFDARTTAMLAWLAGLGAAALTDLADVGGLSHEAAAARLRRLERDGLVSRRRLLHGKPALYLITRSGLRVIGRDELGPARVSSSLFAHALECARVARGLERASAGRFTVHSERELRAWERAAGSLIASAELGFSVAASADVHRPDLVCCVSPRSPQALPLAIEVELTVKAPQRLRAIVRGWARCRRVAGVVYYASPEVARALERAIVEERAEAMVRVLALDHADLRSPVRSTNPIPSAP
jgi:DNA-binding MarR family transcriptional regulator